MSNLTANKIGVFNFNMLLKYIGKDIENLSTTDRLKMKYTYKLIKFFFETLPGIILQIYINNISKSWNIFNLLSFTWTVINIIQTCVFLLSLNIIIKNLEAQPNNDNNLESDREGINRNYVY
jgi:hypothetical protein